MIALSDKLMRIRDALTSIDGVNVYHYRRPPHQADGIVWQETNDNGTNLYADDQLYEQVVVGIIMYWAQEEYDPIVDAIQEALNNGQIGWTLRDVEYDDETARIYHEWQFSI